MTGSRAPGFTVSYMAHVENIGDVQWVRDGQFCGTRGQSLRVEGISVRVCPLSVVGLVHLQGIGDVPLVSDDFAGTRGQSRRLEGFQLSSQIPDVRLNYMATLQGLGDVPFVSDGQFVGTRGQSRRLEGFAINLSGPRSGQFDVWYMAHVQDWVIATGSKMASFAVQEAKTVESRGCE